MDGSEEREIRGLDSAGRRSAWPVETVTDLDEDLHSAIDLWHGMPQVGPWQHSRGVIGEELHRRTGDTVVCGELLGLALEYRVVVDWGQDEHGNVHRLVTEPVVRPQQDTVYIVVVLDDLAEGTARSWQSAGSEHQ